ALMNCARACARSRTACALSPTSRSRYGRLAAACRRFASPPDPVFATGRKECAMLGAIIFWASAIGVLLPLALAVALLWLWGGARRGALGHLMADELLLVSGAVFYYVQVINVFARMDNTYLYNDIFGSYFMLLGVTLLIGSLAGYGVPPWLA